MRYYPAFLNIEGKQCVVVGGGGVAARKAEALLKAGARVRVVAPEIGTALKRLQARYARQGPRLEVRLRRYAKPELAGAWLVIAATNDQQVQEAVARDAQEPRLFCNLADSASGSGFLVPASFQRGDLQVAISTGGASPALARRIRLELEKALGPEYADLLELLRELRPRVIFTFEARGRRDAFRRLADGRVLELLRKGQRAQARRLLSRNLNLEP